MIRTLTAFIAAPILIATGFRFSKNFRWGVSLFHRAVFASVDVVRANLLADAVRPQGKTYLVFVEV